MQRLSDAIQTFHDEVVNLKAQVDALERRVATTPEDKAADTLTNKILLELAEHLTLMNRRINEIEADGGMFSDEIEKEFHHRIKVLERDLYGYEAGVGLNADFEALQTRVKTLEEKVT